MFYFQIIFSKKDCNFNEIYVAFKMLIIQCCQIHTFSREFTWIHKFSHFFTKSFFLPVKTANKAKLNIASHELFHKKSVILPVRDMDNMDCFEYERFFVKKLMRGYILALFVKKCENLWIHVKKCEILWLHVNSREKVWIWQHCLWN
jgi:hypothetical protein